MIHYRKATVADIPTLIKLRIDFLKEVTGIDNPGNVIAEGLEQYFNEHLLQGDFINWLALDGEDIIATGGICFYQIPPGFLNVTGNRAYILNVYAIKAYRRQGIAKNIFEKLMQEAHSRSILQISLHATDDGKNLYEHFGFKIKDNEMVWGKHI